LDNYFYFRLGLPTAIVPGGVANGVERLEELSRRPEGFEMLKGFRPVSESADETIFPKSAC
jgi:hypothetical protein